MKKTPKRYFIDPFGCVKNQVDAENMMAHLNNSGWENTTNPGHADIIIVNSCGFIESAKKESINAVFEWRKIYPNKKILLAGCLSQRYAQELKNELHEADYFMGVEDISQITKKVNNLKTKNKNSNGINKFTRTKKKVLYTGERPLLSLPGSAYIKISEGCNNNCSYCAIPLIRGKLVCRKIPDIIKEFKSLINRGINELCIIGQDIGAYDKGLNNLLKSISMLKGDFWVRLLYIHPDHFPMEILDLIERDKRFLPYFDIPFQHGSEKILTAMNRKGSSKKYLELIKTIRSRLPNAVIRSTFLLGFPGETEEDFSALLDFQKKAKLDWLGCFTYSREEDTAAYSMKKRVSTKTAAARKKIIEENQIPITEKNMNRFVNQTLEVLVEEKIENNNDNTHDENLWLGRLYCQAPDIDGSTVIVCENKKDLQLGSIVKCKVTARRGFDLEVRA